MAGPHVKPTVIYCITKVFMLNAYRIIWLKSQEMMVLFIINYTVTFVNFLLFIYIPGYPAALAGQRLLQFPR